MRRLKLALLTGAYLCLALIVSLLMWRTGAAPAVGLSAFIGMLGLCFAFHGLISNAFESVSVRMDIETVREAHAILLEQLSRVDARMTELVETVTLDAQRRSDELSTEVHQLEDLIQDMNARLEHQLTHQVAAARVEVRGRSPQSNIMLEVVQDALAENRVDLYLQPVVSLPQRRTVFYESFSRLRDETGRVMMPAEYLAVAEPEGLMTAIDNLLLFRCVQIVRRLAKQDRKVGIFCNISLASLADESFFPQFLEFMQANKDLAGAVFFELGQAAFDQRGPVEARHMARLAALGFQFSIDKVVDLDMDFQDLSRADVKFLKIGAQMLLDQLQEQDGKLVIASLPDLNAADFAALTRRYGIEVIVEKVEAERQIVDILDLDIGYGQGHLFGEPRAIRDAVLAEAEPPQDFLRGALGRRTANW
ncbi:MULTISPECIES: flagella assembly cyclic-di-GMP phosphodiesterase TipF [unclassified Caulobacter]|uniref:flagella assembly cyclic-di-GMP phosphodiesterase TipF n=1 Tax=unclassified Caulobacter TaxID=2648921 RepID=UPI000D3784A4|nr:MULTISPECIES: EAL domain-containing protein [unclassified Caulobacter]PTS91782.1 diguanylate phosphodiesterase [Caulobacter sp. HMWF009]PTT04732.1 diguanylate phosphodiesterase [Caulobacter sp. HMWF025]